MALAFLKSTPVRILFYIFIANFFYDDPTLYLYKRIIYSIFIYLAIGEIVNFYIDVKRDPFSTDMPAFYNVYLPIVFVVLISGLVKDITNPNLNIVTLVNHPYAALALGPIFLFAVGANSDDLDAMLDFFLVMTIAFILVFALPVFGKVKYYQGYVCANAFIPMFILSVHLKRLRFVAVFMLLFALFFSNLSGYRIIALRILLFFSLYISMLTVKKFGPLKFLIIAFASFCLYHFIANLEDILYLFKSIIGVKSFDDDDTRGFLWEELFQEMNSLELIWGRGFLGTYFSEYFLMLIVRYHQWGDHYDRFGSEVGFLHLLLKGGWVLYITYISPILYSSLKGIFGGQKDNLVFGFSIYLLTELMLMFIENIPYFCIQFSTIFFIAGFIIKRLNQHEDLDNHPIVQPG
jgi:hypothetical protein